MNRDDVIQRWRSNANAAGVRLTDEDIERITSRGGIDRVLAVEEILARADARDVVPDYLAVLTGGHGGE